MTREKTRGVIAAGHNKTAAAGEEMFALGGNAFDAAIAAALASFVVEPGLTSAAGGGFLLARTGSNEQILYDFFTQTPRRGKNFAEVDFYPVEINFGVARQVFHIGMGSLGVPGNIAGLFTVHEQLGKLPLKVVAEPAINYARNGVEINSYQGSCLGILEPILLTTPESRHIFTSGGQLLKQGNVQKMPNFATTLEELVKEGKDAFYQGEIAQKIVRDCQEKGGYLTLEDLGKYQVIIRQPLALDYRGHKLLTNPYPSTGGSLIFFALQLLKSLDFTSLEFASPQHLQILAHVMSLTNEARKEKYDNSVQSNKIPQDFFSSNYLHIYQQKLAKVANKWGSTTHISTLDAAGNAASITTSNGEGSGYIIPGTDIMVNNMLGEADLNPLGFHNWPLNQRLSSMMSPTIVLEQDQPRFVLGSGGSNRIRTAILQVISNLIDFQLPLDVAVETSRVHWEDCQFNVEPQANLEDLQLPEHTELITWDYKSMFFGGVNAVERSKDGSLQGMGDPRRDGAVRQIE